MTPKHAKQILEVFTHFANGGNIEVQHKKGDEEWYNASSPIWNADCNYRKAKPAPPKFMWINVDDNDYDEGDCFKNKISAIDSTVTWDHKAVKYRIDDE